MKSRYIVIYLFFLLILFVFATFSLRGTARAFYCVVNEWFGKNRCTVAITIPEASINVTRTPPYKEFPLATTTTNVIHEQPIIEHITNPIVERTNTIHTVETVREVSVPQAVTTTIIQNIAGTYDDSALWRAISLMNAGERSHSDGGNHASAGYLVAANNLSDLPNTTTARTNLGLGALATLSAVSGGTGGTITDGTIDETDLDTSVNASLTLANSALQAEADTLNTVTGRGNTTTNAISVGTTTITGNLTATGNVGIGTTTPTAKFTTTGTVQLYGLGTNTTNTNILTTDAVGNVTTNTIANLLGTGTSHSLSYASSTGILTSTINGLTATATIIPHLTTSYGVLSTTNGGTGTSTIPTFGQLLMGDGLGGYTLVATSSLGIVGGGTNYWTLSGSNLYNNSGTNVGIGTTTPYSALSIGSSSSTPYLALVDTDPSSSLDWAFSHDGAGIFRMDTIEAPDGSMKTSRFLLDSLNGNTYLGTNSGASSGYMNFGVNDGLWSNTLGGMNIGINNALNSNTSGHDNIGMNGALNANTEGSYNIALGENALNQSEASDFNIALGTNALNNQQTGSNNIAIGQYTGSNLSNGTSTILIGDHANVAMDGLSNAVAIGPYATVGCSDCIVLGGADPKHHSNVGIGTTTPFAKLSVAGSMALTGAFYDKDSSAGTSGMVLQTTGSGTQWVATSMLDIPNYWTLSGSNLYNNSGTNVGIGTTTPDANLVVTAPGTAILKVNTTNDPVNYGLQLVSKYDSADSFYLQDGPARLLGRKNNLGAGASRTTYLAGYNGISFATQSLNPSLSDVKMTINQIGNVGIGTTTPTAKFTTTGTVQLYGLGTNTTNTNILTTDASGNVTTNTFANLLNLSSTTLATMYYQQGGNTFGTTATLGTNDNNMLNLVTNGSPRVSILSNGNVGIGTTTPQGKFHMTDYDVNTKTNVYEYTGSDETVVIPADVTSINVKVWGAGGGSGGIYGAAGGGGAYTVSTLAVTPGETITVAVGGGGGVGASGTNSGGGSAGGYAGQAPGGVGGKAGPSGTSYGGGGGGEGHLFDVVLLYCLPPQVVVVVVVRKAVVQVPVVQVGRMVPMAVVVQWVARQVQVALRQEEMADSHQGMQVVVEEEGEDTWEVQEAGILPVIPRVAQVAQVVQVMVALSPMGLV